MGGWRFQGLIWGLFTLVVNAPAQEVPYDLLIVGGRVVDGTGSSWFRAELGIRDGRVVALGRRIGEQASRRIDASGLTVAPGFIDLHAHVSSGLLERPTADNFIRMGVTTVVDGNDGGSPWPIGEFLRQVRIRGSAVNLALLVGHGTVRELVMGNAARSPTPDELDRLVEFVEEGSADGAFGLSTGLEYVPGLFAETDELVALARAVKPFGGYYATHLRDEGEGLESSLTEALTVAERAEVPLHLSHFKVVGPSMWGRAAGFLARVDSARAAGLEVTLDQYPYTATLAPLTLLFPAWAKVGGVEALTDRLRREGDRRRLKEALAEKIGGDRGGPDRVVLATYGPEPELAGLNLAGIAERWGLPPTAEGAAIVVMDLQLRGGGTAIYHVMAEEDVRAILVHGAVAPASDGGLERPETGHPHPRSYGTFPEVLGRYVREEGVLTLEEAIRKMTSLPAQRLGLPDRGVVREGVWADLVLFDPGSVAAGATWEAPRQPPVGIRHVLVNGEPVLLDGQVTGRLPGMALHSREEIQ